MNEFMGQELSNDELFMLDDWLRDAKGKPFWTMIAADIESDILNATSLDKPQEVRERACVSLQIHKLIRSLPAEIRDKSLAISRKQT